MIPFIKLRETLWTARKPGWQPPPSLLLRMRRIHPRCRLVWSPEYQSWGLIERTLDGKWETICRIDGQPNVANTIGKLNELCGARLADWDRFTEFERQLDAPQERIEREINESVDDRLQEGHDRMWHELGPSHSVSMPKGEQ